ncbi:ABC transporter ATP-binding protein [Jeotgalibacillus proteolyticus]|uniref:ABC transporter ATP-binding protein n=1 Tax=Jeotgalibacillus proteolyticus TaxID=2082395 RepID=UPI003CFAD9EF
MTQALIQMNDVHFRYPGSEEWVLKGASLEVEKGEFLAIIGNNGSGKSTLCKAMNGLIPHYYAGDVKGEVSVNGKEAFTSAVAVLSQEVGYVYQDFEQQLMRPTVLDDVAFAPLNFGKPDYKEKALWALEVLDLMHLKDQSIWSLSGGQKHLTAIAGALALDPGIIIVDEPVAQLDPYHAKKIYEKLKELNEKHGKTIIVIEHHTEFIADYARTLLLMKDGQVNWKLPVHEGLSRVQELMELGIYPPQVTQLAAGLNGQRTMSYPITLEQGVSFFQPIRKEVRAFSQQKVNGEKNPLKTIEAEEVSHHVRTMDGDKKTILNNISLTFGEGEKVALVGTNGAGKTTLLKALAGLSRPSDGEIRVEGNPIRKIRASDLSDHVAYVFQNPEEMMIQDTVEKDLSFFSRSRGRLEKDQAFLSELSTSFNLHDLSKRDARLLSGGQQRRSSMAIGVAMRPMVLLLDEPTASLDIVSRREMTRMLHKTSDHCKTVIVATHDMELVAEWATRVIVMEEGEVIFDGAPRSLFQDEKTWKKANLRPPQIVELSLQLGCKPVFLSVKEMEEAMKVGAALECMA